MGKLNNQIIPNPKYATLGFISNINSRPCSSIATSSLELVGLSLVLVLLLSVVQSIQAKSIAVIETTESIIDFTPHDETLPYISIEEWHEKYLWWRIILVVDIMLLGFVGNLSIIYSIWKVPRFRSKPTNLFILNMACGDLITSTFCPIVALIKVVNEFYVMGPFICRIEGFLKNKCKTVTSLSVSSYSLIVISFQWWICIVKPFKNRMTVFQSWIALGLIWALSLGLGIPLIFSREYKTRKWSNLIERWCPEDTKFITIYWITVCFLLIYVPTICMTIALVIILVKMDKLGSKLRRSVQQSNQTPNADIYGIDSSVSLTHDNGNQKSNTQNNSLASETSGNQVPGSNPNRVTKQKGNLAVNMKYRRHIVSILLVYLIVSVVCWAPLNVSIIYRISRIGRTTFSNSSYEFNFFCELGVATSSALNPIIFGFLSRPFRGVLAYFWASIWKFVICSKVDVAKDDKSRRKVNSKRRVTRVRDHKHEKNNKNNHVIKMNNIK